MKNKSIQTNLLSVFVIIGEETGTAHGPPSNAAGKPGEIVNVYYDSDGDLKYTIRVGDTNKLIELYPCSFTIDPEQPSHQ